MKPWVKQVLFFIGCTVLAAMLVGVLFGPLLFSSSKPSVLTLTEAITYMAMFGGVMGALIALLIMFASGFGKHDINWR